MQTTINPHEVAKFSAQSQHWWDIDGPFKTLHHINTTRIEFIVKFTDVTQKTCLDIGCGGGILSEGLARCGAIVTGLDASEEAIRAAQEHAQQSHLSIPYHAEPIETFEHEQFDIITCMEMLEHVASPGLVIEHCKRLLKPGGLLFLSTINRTWQAYVSVIVGAEYIFNLLPRQTHSFEHFIKPSELHRLVKSHNFELLGLAGLHYNPLNHHSALTKNITGNYLMVCQL